MILRDIEPTLRDLSRQYPVVTVTGPRQSGKTTLCRRVFPDKPYVNLEAPDIRRFAAEDPRGFMAGHPDGAILDEIQRVPELVSYLQPEVDANPGPGRFILTGSQQFEVMSTISQSLAGRTGLLKLLPFSLPEVARCGEPPGIDGLLFNGFYPRIYDQGLNPTRVLGDYVETYVERDLRQLIAIRDLGVFETFLRLCAGRVGQLLNMHALANDVGISHTTVRSWITLLEASYLVFRLQPWHANVGKRLVKTPKLYFHDVGLAAYLLGITQRRHVPVHPLRGNLFENLVIAEVLKHLYNRGLRNRLFFYRDSAGNEVDLLLEHGPDLLPLEIKAGATVAPGFFKGLKRFSVLFPRLVPGGGVVYGGDMSQSRSDWPIYPIWKLDGLFKRVLG